MEARGESIVERTRGSFGRLRGFIVETWAELQKTSWPAKKEVQGTTVVVLVAVFLTALYLYVVDLAIDSGLRQIMEVFGR